MAIQSEFNKLATEITECHKCTRLVKWREKVSVEKRASYASETYWGKPIAGFGDMRAKILVLGLAPARTAQIALVEFSPVIAVVTGCLGRCIKQDWHRSLNQFRAMTV